MDAGANVVGYSLEPPTNPSLFHMLGYDGKNKPANLTNIFADIRDFTYLTIAAVQANDNSKAGFYNVDPDECDCVTTGDLVKLFGKYYGNQFKAEINHEPNAPHEANFLKLDTSLVKATFGWQPTWHIEQAIEKTVEWTKAWLAGEDVDTVMGKQIGEFVG